MPQPTTEVGPASTYSTATFLWNAATPDVNLVNSAASTSGLKGTDSTGTDGKYRLMNNTDGGLTFALTAPTGAYSVALVLAFPSGSIGTRDFFRFSTGGGMRVDLETTGGGVRFTPVHTGTASGTVLIQAASFDTNKWIYVLRYDGTTLRHYLRDRTGTNYVTFPVADTIGYGTPTGSGIKIGHSTQASFGIYAAMVVPSDIGDTNAQAIIADPWTMFAAPPTAPTVGTASSIGSTTADANWTDNSGDETGFKVESAPDPFSSWTPQGTAAADATTHPMTGLAPGTDHRFRVASTNGAGDSAWQTSATFTTTSGTKGRALLLGVG